MAMTNLKSDPKETKASTLCCPDYEAPAYPYGLSISLCDESMQKLGMTTAPPIGTVITFVAKATVTSVSQYETTKPDSEGANKERSVGLQITDMDFGGQEKPMSDRLYGG